MEIFNALVRDVTFIIGLYLTITILYFLYSLSKLLIPLLVYGLIRTFHSIAGYLGFHKKEAINTIVDSQIQSELVRRFDNGEIHACEAMSALCSMDEDEMTDDEHSLFFSLILWEEKVMISANQIRGHSTIDD